MELVVGLGHIKMTRSPTVYVCNSSEVKKISSYFTCEFAIIGVWGKENDSYNWIKWALNLDFCMQWNHLGIFQTSRRVLQRCALLRVVIWDVLGHLGNNLWRKSPSLTAFILVDLPLGMHKFMPGLFILDPFAGTLGDNLFCHLAFETEQTLPYLQSFFLYLFHQILHW